MHGKNKETKSFTTFFIVLPRVIFRTQTKAYGGAFLQK